MAELPCVRMSRSALHYSSEDFSVVLQVKEVFRWFQGWFHAVGDGKVPFFGCTFPLLLPCLQNSPFGSSFCVGI